MNYYVSTIIALLFLSSCTKPVQEPSFYYWKTQFRLSSTEKKTLEDLNAQHLYLRCFDVDIPSGTSESRPLGIIQHADSVPETIEVTPVVFITNRTFMNLTEANVQLLAKRVVAKLNEIRSNYTELQFDCDWSPQTRKSYFLFLQEVKKISDPHLTLSATIRLHQVKYPGKTGVPPVERGMLMFYNMGNLSDVQEENSIYRKENAEKYTDYLEAYKLPLDVALPIFRWYVHYRDGKVVGLVTKSHMPDVRDTVYFDSQKKKTNFNARFSFFSRGIYYKKGDLLKSEAISAEALKEAARTVHKDLKPEKRRIVFYDLDELNIQYYDDTIFKEVLAVFN